MRVVEVRQQFQPHLDLKEIAISRACAFHLRASERRLNGEPFRRSDSAKLLQYLPSRRAEMLVQTYVQTEVDPNRWTESGVE